MIFKILNFRKKHITSLLSGNYLLIIALILLLSSCSNLRYLDEGQQLYTGSKVKIESEEKISGKGGLVSEMERVLRPQPNEKFLFWRPRLWFYNVAGEDPGNALTRYMRNRIGRPPVLFEDFSVDRSMRLMENRLFNMGFFDSQLEYQISEKKKTAGVEFMITLSPAFTIAELLPVESDAEIARHINESLDETLIKPGRDYHLSILREERERITAHLKDLGYFYFHSDFLLFRADTTGGQREVSLSLALKTNIPANAKERFNIRNIYINTAFTLVGDQQLNDTIYMGEGIYLLNNNDEFKPSTLKRAIFFEKDKLYNSNDHDLTLNHLMGLGVFKFVNLRFLEINDVDTPSLDLRVQLTPMDKKNISAEIRGITKSTNFAGPGLSIAFNNRNFLGGAENFNLNLEGAYETYIGQTEKRARSWDVGASAELSTPRFIVPFGTGNLSPRFIPRTSIGLSFNFRSRTDAFSISSIRSNFGYMWNQSITTQYRFNPFVFNIFSLGSVSEEYEQILQEEQQRRGLFEQFLLGSEFSYYHNSQLREPRKHAWYFNYNIDLSGNLAYLIFQGLNLGEEQEEGGYGIFNQSFSQYARNDFDLRYYLDLGHNQKLATRLAAGIGVPYGNSSTLPYIKLFTTGGSNSIRAFQPRSLGPGSYSSPDTLQTTFNIYQSGDIKLEFNIEYRFSMTRIIKGALFADAGNIWNLKERERTPGGKFETSEFLSQMALGTGAGLRLDFTFFILRLDLAFPLAIPYDDSPGYFQSIRPLDGSWRRDNLLLNLAIGYPF
ncbi:MAG: outer membrane protein assembly factor [Bacteroidales bacterium]|nr:outer membrane protein assembly factor [Bacteroidales bacterium]